MNPTPLARQQAQRLAALLQAVLAGNAFYRNKLAAAGIDPSWWAGPGQASDPRQASDRRQPLDPGQSVDRGGIKVDSRIEGRTEARRADAGPSAPGSASPASAGPASAGPVSADPAFARPGSAGTVPADAHPGNLEAILGRLPFTTKAELLADQEAHPPFGTHQTYPGERYVRLHQTSGTSGRPLVWTDTAESWSWVVDCWTKIYRGVGLLPSDRIFFPFSFGPFLGFWSAFEGAARVGNLAIPGGGMTTVARLEAIRSLGATIVAATPTYALHMAEVAREERIDLRAAGVRALIVAGEPGGSVASTREKIETAWGARCFDHCGMTEVGPFGYECPEAPGGLHVLEEDYIVEVIDPQTGRRLPEGSEGELVITNLGRTASPAIRYRTGDLVRWSRRPCPCGTARGRLEGGILGRKDDMVIVRGNNVFPSAVEAILRKIPEVGEYRVRLLRKSEMTHMLLEVEPSGAGTAIAARGADTREPRPPGQRGDPAAGNPPTAELDGGNQDLVRRVSSAMESAFLFQPEVAIVPRGTLPRFELKARRWIKEF